MEPAEYMDFVQQTVKSVLGWESSQNRTESLRRRGVFENRLVYRSSNIPHSQTEPTEPFVEYGLGYLVDLPCDPELWTREYFQKHQLPLGVSIQGFLHINNAIGNSDSTTLYTADFETVINISGDFLNTQKICITDE